MELEILKISEYGWFDLLDEDGKERKLNLEFHDLPRELKVGDTIKINDLLLDENYEGYCGAYAFGPITSQFGKKIESFSDVDCAVLNLDDKTIFLKRLYG